MASRVDLFARPTTFEIDDAWKGLRKTWGKVKEAASDLTAPMPEPDMYDPNSLPNEQHAGEGLARLGKAYLSLQPDEEDMPVIGSNPDGTPMRMDPTGMMGVMGAVKKVSKAAGKKVAKVSAISVDDIMRANPDALYHSTTKKNAKSIGDIGLIPQHGKISNSAYGEYLNDAISHYNNDVPDPVSFMAKEPSGFYSHWQSLKKGENPSYDDIRLHALKKKGGGVLISPADDIYHATPNKSGEVVNPTLSTTGEQAKYLPELPRNVEAGDYISFERQTPKHVFTDTEYLELLTKRDTSFLELLPEKQKKALSDLKDLPSAEFQKKIKARLKADPTLAIAGATFGAAALAGSSDANAADLFAPPSKKERADFMKSKPTSERTRK